jgi:hypothetical protein
VSEATGGERRADRFVKWTDVLTGESWVMDTRRRIWERDWWVTIGPEPEFEQTILPFAVMDDRHISNVIAWLRRRAFRLHEDAIATTMRWMSGPFGPGGDMAVEAADLAFEELIATRPRDWLEETSVMRGLKGELLLRYEPWLVDHDEREHRAREVERRARATWEAERDFRSYYGAAKRGGRVWL